VFNEFFNELGYNPGPKQGGFMFFADWGIHNLNSVVSAADAHGPVGRTLAYLNCNVLPILNGVASVNNTVKVAVALLKPPTAEECVQLGVIGGGAGKASASRAGARRSAGFGGGGAGLLGSKHNAFARLSGGGR
jgi:hypothetical protein